ncbi:MAG: hypothetical protein RL272_591 [Candidatus Parcubacteria bacterium]|jgi:hypothetical protein
MRSLQVMVSAFGAFVILIAGCGPLGPDPGSCGDGRCNYAAGESNYSCPADCQPSRGGPDGGAGPGGYCGDHLPVASGGVSLPVSPMPQLCEAWCWAASSTMIATYYGISATECGLASVKAGFRYPACCDYAACSYPVCDQGAYPREEDAILGQVLGIHGFAIDASLTEVQVQTELSNGRPFIVWYSGSFSGHLVVVSGFARSGGQYLYRVNDPYYGVFDVTYGQLVYGYHGGGQSWLWNKTWYHLSPRADGCNLDFDPDCRCE